VDFSGSNIFKYPLFGELLVSLAQLDPLVLILCDSHRGRFLGGLPGYWRRHGARAPTPAAGHDPNGKSTPTAPVKLRSPPPIRCPLPQRRT
jgi:hypothetical protein